MNDSTAVISFQLKQLTPVVAKDKISLVESKSYF